MNQGLIPLGEAFELDPPNGPINFDWTANVANGTSLAFLMTDALDRQGGSSSLLVSLNFDKAVAISKLKFTFPSLPDCWRQRRHFMYQLLFTPFHE